MEAATVSVTAAPAPQTSTISIGNWDPEAQLMIEYLYTGVIPDIPYRIEMDLFKLAVKYDLIPVALMLLRVSRWRTSCQLTLS